MFRTSRFMLFIFSLLLISAPVLAQESKVVTSEGVAVVQGSNLDIARDAAVSDAQQKAVEQAIGILIDSQTQVENFQVISDNILSQTKGYIKRYNIVREAREDNLLCVTITAEVALGKLGDDLSAIGILMGQTTNAQTETTEQQIEALKSYYGDTYGDEEEGRSQVCTREVFETIEWTRPDLMRVFASGGQVVFLEETSPEDGQYARDASDYLQWIFWTDNRGYEILDVFAFDGLLHRRGYLAVYWRDKEYRAPQTLTGLNIMQVQQLMADPAVEIVGQDFDQESEAGGITLVVRRTKSRARAEIVTVPPEDMRFNGRAVDLDAARYVGRVIRMMRGEVARMWPEKAAEINEYSGKGVGHAFARGSHQRGRAGVRVHPHPGPADSRVARGDALSRQVRQEDRAGGGVPPILMCRPEERHRELPRAT